MHIPAAEDVAGDLRTDPMAAIRSGQVTGLSRADTRAILEDGADPYQVINARRGMYTAGGRKFTTEGVTSRGLAGQRLGDLAKRGGRYRSSGIARPRPEQIFKDSNGNREEALRLLRRFGYLI